jgi:hypothetical protein
MECFFPAGASILHASGVLKCPAEKEQRVPLTQAVPDLSGDHQGPLIAFDCLAEASNGTVGDPQVFEGDTLAVWVRRPATDC